MDYANELISRAFTRMECESKSHVKEAFSWVSKNIESCQNSFHMECAMKLIELFGEKYGRPDLIEDLCTLFYIKKVMLQIP